MQPIDFDKLEKGLHLEISSREDYFKDCCPDFECEMFDGDGIDFYSSFTIEDAYKVVHTGNRIGELPYSPQLREDENVLLAAKIWKILFVEILLLAVLERLLRNFQFGYRSPFLYP